MLFLNWCLFAMFALASLLLVAAQERGTGLIGFEVPVQLVGFPVIIMAVKMSNFIKKLSYAINPNTYRSARHTRNALPAKLNYRKAEKEIVKKFGNEVCVFEDICMKHIGSSGIQTPQDWQNIISDYVKLPPKKQEFYLLSVFLGEIINSPELCSHFTHIGRSCNK